jgi:exonuclease SbcC
MKFLRLLVKPKWQHKDAEVRRAAVAQLHDAELEAALPQILRNDTDAGVRLAALRRLDDYELWRERSTADADGALRGVARTTYVQRLMSGAARSVPSLDRRIAELDTLSGDELEQLATSATDTPLRSAALERVKRPSLLVDRAVSDPEPGLRLTALERINDLDALARVAERSRKTDKTISRLAREKLEALRIAAGDADAIALRARQLCERSEALLQQGRGQRVAELAAIDQAWQPLAARAPQALKERLEATLAFLRSDTDEAAVQRERLRKVRAQIGVLLLHLDSASAAEIEPLLAEATATLVAAPQELVERGPVEEGVTRMMRRLATLAAQVHEPAPVAVIEPTVLQVDAVAAQARFDATLAAAHEEARRERERTAQRRELLDADVIELERLLENGDISNAHAVHARVEKTAAELPPAAQHDKRLVNAQTRYAELKRWQHWSNNEQRKRLCDAVEALSGSGLHPDAVATRVREARAEWLLLDASEGASVPEKGERPTQGLGRRFQALCNQALKPARGYFEKRQELRRSNEQDVAQLIARAATVPDDQTDRAAWFALRTELGGGLRALDGVEPRQRKLLAQQLKDGLARIDERLAALNAAAVAGKRELIAKAQRAAQQTDRIAATRELRTLQKQWKDVGSGRRKDDEALWQEFRGICDRVFGELDAQRQQRAADEAQNRADALATIDAMEALASAAPEEVRAQRREIEARWAALPQHERELEPRWRRALEKLDTQRDEQVRRDRHALFDIAHQRLLLCERVETQGASDEATAAWQALAAVPGELGAALQARFDAANAGSPARLAESDLDTARDLLVQLDYHSGVETPAEDRQRRMDWQVSRLSQRLRQGDTTAPREELLDLLSRWVALGGLPDPAAGDLRARFETAYAAAVQRLP